MGSLSAGRILAIFLAAAACAAVANVISGPERRLAWIRPAEATERATVAVAAVATGLPGAETPVAAVVPTPPPTGGASAGAAPAGAPATMPAAPAAPTAPTAPAAPAGVAASAASAAPAAPAPVPHPDKPWVEISGDEVKRLFDRGVAFFDARRSAVYRAGHIAGARSFPVWEADIDDRVKAFFAEGVDPSTPLVVYCDGGECEDSHTLAQKLYLAGFDNAMVYKDGYPDWTRRGWPVRPGEKP